MERFDCNTPTVPPETSLRDHMARIENRLEMLRELTRYLAAVRASDRPLAIEEIEA